MDRAKGAVVLMRDWNDHRDNARPTSWTLKLEAMIVGALMLIGLFAAFGALF